MNQILKWLNKHETLVHMIVMFLMLYGLPLAWVWTFQPSMVYPIVTSALLGLALIFVTYTSYATASAVTSLIRNAVCRASLEQIRDIMLDSKIERPRMIDLTSPTTLIVENLSQETRDAVDNLKQVVSDMNSSSVTAHKEIKSKQEELPPPAEKKRTPRNKSAKKES